MRDPMLFIALLLLSACTTLDQQGAKEPPEISKNMSVNDALAAGIEFGGTTLEKVKKLFTTRNDWAQVEDTTTELIPTAVSNYGNSSLINLLHFYQASTKKADITVFSRLVGSERPMARVLGWNLAANLPSPEIRQAMDEEFSRRMRDAEEEVLYLPGMARAVQANSLDTAYTLLREGLFATGDEAFARAMMSIDGRAASDDFLDYLSKASVEELRQLNQEEVNMYTCLIALGHLAVVPPSINHPHINQLFLYAVSRNQALSESAHMVLERAVGSHTQYLAILLSRLPDWIQIAYIESARRRITPVVQTFLAALKEATPHESVVEEIRTIR